MNTQFSHPQHERWLAYLFPFDPREREIGSKTARKSACYGVYSGCFGTCSISGQLPSRCFHHEPLILKQLIIVFPKT
ncbi:hypothetical protein FTE28_04905 [Bacillus licheniformis]|nr:hypothetical protein MUY_002322 [Bacillus licheniformis WX-02]AMR10646.1 hypothetical protein AB684_10790 [Bacillus licheniformis]APJ27313.1 hypothetical protein BSZ43_11185 [Bacillus sp. H15-1]ASV15712.1 hypothetical protein CJO35_11270 [Bacillus sp. 1s-1]EQM27688.1 hypothetical protein N399_12645 [Bacillus licheniformis CG-B52]KUL10910.1 hypothetical protein LI17339_13360 [Bacillus licheniformis LMG 17339]MBY8346856.1 hypothetical protein [Bacillus sp. PCH94]NBB45041.1 hypothetical prot